VAGTLMHISPSYAMPEAIREDYLAAYEGDRFVESMRYVRAYPADLPILRDLLPAIQTPVEIISGAHDTAVPPVNGEYLRERLPKSKLDVMDAGHFTWEDDPVAYAGLVTAWWSGGYASAGPAPG
jgi:pimeloyl-ACP methyl ester carboxylesterase